MKANLYLLTIAGMVLTANTIKAEQLLHLPMEANKHGELTENIGKGTLRIYGHNTNENMPGAVGKALRFDGYSTYAQGSVKGMDDLSGATFSMWVAPETYPVIEQDTPTTKKTTLAGTFDETAKQGWAFCMGYTGKYSFKIYSGGWPVEVEADDIIPCYEWSRLTAVFDGANEKLTLYRNGKKVGEKKVMATFNGNATKLTVGKNADSKGGIFALDTFNGLIDEIIVTDQVATPEEIASAKAENEADLTIPASRFEEDILRPKFHGMPGANWTNETHGMTYSNGRYHVFFQKNANGPYMTRLHWGHISSDNLYDWREEPIAIAPGADFDIKGCWSGAVFTDDEITGGKPNVIYTAVDYAKATIAQASPLDNDLLKWEKGSAPIINGRPAGLSDDFRDPYFFRDGENAYIVVGTSKGNVGAATLHRYNPQTKTWSNNGDIFFKGNSKASDGRFWEMPTVTKMADGKWLVTVTPLETAKGVHTLYWTGDINSDGTFSPDAASAQPRDFELISEDGYGLLSPTIYNHEGKIITMGIVPDKVSTSDNCSWGWAHLYSFPREISLDASGNLVQKPYSELRGLRSEKCDLFTEKSINGTVPFVNAEGRQLELFGKFIIGDSAFGFTFFKGAGGEASVSYNPATNELTADFSKLSRISNDGHLYNGVYTEKLPAKPAKGSELTLNVFVDGSIVDIFVNDTYATSIRVFPKESEAVAAEAFSRNGSVMATQLGAWQLKSTGSAGVESLPFGSGAALDDKVDVVSISGMLLKRGVSREEASKGLEKGIYLIGGKKVAVR
ncbi:MAG: GH32 C-terminal domain-containing protein [Muribaculaceae bacterium]|nr:GH32 C-terminal domain-containing protein [Muribaculaceae bacterium]